MATIFIKVCNGCGESKPVSGFYRHKGRKDGYQERCKACHVAYARNRYATRHAEVRAINDRSRQKKRLWVIADKLARGCADCGYRQHVEALEYDHRPGEEKWTLTATGRVWRPSAFNISWSLERIQTEVAKCDVVCANCHRVRSAERRAG
jgi:hypothetical protein